MAKAKEPQADGARHVAIGIEIKRASEPADRALRAIDLRQLSSNLLSIGFFGFRPILDFSAAQDLDHQTRGIICAGRDPTRQPPRFLHVSGRKGLRCGPRTVEYHRCRSIQILAKEVRMLLLFRFARETLQKLFTASASGGDHHHPYAVPPNRLQDVWDIIRTSSNNDYSFGLFCEIVDHGAHRFTSHPRIDVERPGLELLAVVP